MLSEFNLKI